LGTVVGHCASNYVAVANKVVDNSFAHEMQAIHISELNGVRCFRGYILTRLLKFHCGCECCIKYQDATGHLDDAGKLFTSFKAYKPIISIHNLFVPSDDYVKITEF
jgi:hypothetical protein